MTRAPFDPRKPMDGLTRRSFLRASGVAGAAAVLAGAAGVSLHEVLARAASDPLADGTPVLVLVTMYGGNDGLNTVVPYADPAYHDARPELAYTADEVHRLDDSFGLNPGLSGLADEWSAGRLAIVRGVGYPNPDHSHFTSMDIWQTGSPGSPVQTGWVGRWLDATGSDPLRAITIGATVPVLAMGASCTAAALAAGTARTSAPALPTAVTALAKADPSDGPAHRLVVSSYASTTRLHDTVEAHLPGRYPTLTSSSSSSTSSSTSATSPTTAAAQASRTSSGNPFTDQLATVAACIRAGAPTQVYSVALSSFDTHADEKGTQTGLLSRMDEGLTAFRQAMAGDPREKDVVVVAYSEFGRRVKANASEGTDHGTAAPVLVMGEAVRGGYHSEEPSLTDLDNGDLKATCDFRSLYAELAEKVLRVDAGRVVPGAPAQLGVLA